MTSHAWVACLLAMAAAAVVYFGALNNPFVYDDHRVVVENPSIVSLSNLEAIAIFEPARPLVNLSYAIDFAFWGLHPFGFHVTSLLLHLINVLLVYALAWRLSQDWRQRSGSDRAAAVKPEVVAFSAALMFAIHPIMTEAVGYISGRSELLCGTFVLSAFLAARRWMRDSGRGWLVATGVFWALALASKEIAVMFPCLVVAYDLWVRPGTVEDRLSRAQRLYVPLAIVAALAVTWRVGMFVSREHADAALRWRYALIELDAIRQYLLLVLLPIGQTIFHDVPVIPSLADPRAITAMLELGLLFALMVGVRRRQGLAAFGLLWFFFLLVPSSVLVMLDRGEPMAEHRVYLAGAGLFIAFGQTIGWLLMRFSTARPVPRWILRTAVVLGVVSMVGHTLVRNEVWASPVTLWSEAVDAAPQHWLPRQLLGEALHESGQHDAAVASFQAAVALRPDDLDAYNKLGMCEIETGHLADATAAFKAIQARDPKSTAAMYGLGAIALVEGHHEVARAKFLETIDVDPANVQARRGLAVLEETVGNNPEEALRRCREIQQIAPRTPGNDDCITRNEERLGRRSNAR